MTDTNTVQYWTEQVNTKIADIVNAMKNYVEDFSLDVEVLPAGTDISTYKGVANKMYLLKDASVSEGENWYNEYIFVNNKMELIGTTKPDIKNFYTKAEVVEMLKSYYLKTETYSKSEVNTELGKKANSADVYTKTKADELLGAKANAADVYAKTATYSQSEVDDLLSPKANAADVYTKGQTDTAISTEGAKHYLKTETYTKTEVNGLLGDKANSADVYTKEEANTAISTEGAKHYLKTETYTKTEVDTALSAKANTSTTYTKSEVDTALSGKAAVGTSYAKADTYTKTEVDELVNSKIDSEAVYTKTDVYSKTETDGLLSAKANAADVYAKADVYTKTEANNLLGAKANASTTYTKTEVNNLLGNKANSADVYTTASTYSKTEVDNLVGGKAVLSKVTSLPATGNANTIYIVSNSAGKEGNVNTEYIYVDGKWEIVGSTDVDLSGYYTKSQVDTELDKKANASALTSKANSADVYTKTEVDTKLSGKLGTGDKAASAGTADSATSAVTATKDASGNVITTTYATKSELGAKANSADLADVATSGSYNDLSDKPSIPAAITESTVSGWGFTKNAGTVTKVNNIAPVDGNVTISIPAAVTETTVSGWGFTKNKGTVTGATMNGANVSLTNGVLALGTVLTAHQDISGKANAADVYTKTEIDTKLSSVYKYQGSVASKNNLPATSTAGFVYNVEDTGMNYAWDGSKWDALGSATVDTSNLAAKVHTHAASDVTGLATVATSGSYNDLTNKPTIPSAITESTVSGWGFTKNAGTLTGVKMNNASKTVTNGVVDLGTVITAHQDISGKADVGHTHAAADVSGLATVATSGSYNDLSNKPTIPSAVSETTVSGWGFTKNAGTVTSVNNVAPVNGNVTLTIPSAVTETTVSGWGFTKNAGTITGIKMNNASKGTSGVVDLGTVITSHQSLDSCVKTSGNQTVAGVKTFTGNSVFKGNSYNNQLTAQRDGTSGVAGIFCKNNSANYGVIGMNGDGKATVTNTSGTSYNLLRNSTLDTAIGGANQPVYINASGVAVACNATTSTYSATGTTAVNGTAVNSALDSALSTLATNLSKATLS